MEAVANTKNSDNVATICLRYEGLEAAAHEIDLNQLGQSLQGFAEVFARCVNVIEIGTLYSHNEALGFHVVAMPVAEHHCFEVLAMVKCVAMSREMWSGAFGVVLAVVVQFVLSCGDRDDMKYTHEALQTAMRHNEALVQQNQGNIAALSATVNKMMAVLDKLADSLRSAARQAMAPIDRSCQRIDLYADGERFMSLDAEHKRAFAEVGSTVSSLTAYVGLISEFDMASGTCKVTLKGHASRIPAVVLDPVGHWPNAGWILSGGRSTITHCPIKFTTFTFRVFGTSAYDSTFNCGKLRRKNLASIARSECCTSNTSGKPRFCWRMIAF